MDFLIDLDVDTTKFFEISDEWEKIEKAIIKGIELGEAEFIIRLRDKVLQNLTKYGLGSSELAHNITLEKRNDGIAITMGDADYAIFVEYGTGIIGAENPHPNPKITWIYSSGENSNGHEGWFYPTIPTDPNPYKHEFNGQLYAFTKGQKSRPFMYESWLWGTRSAKNIINKNIRREVKKVI